MLSAGLIGDPVAHSRSPGMHNAAFGALGIDARYALWPTPLQALPERIAALRGPDMLGANVTIPHKQAVMPLLDDLAESARLVGAVNTIVVDHGRLIGQNTDASGLVAALREAGQARLVAGVILGAGGAARAAAVALAQLGVGHIRILARQSLAARIIALTLAPQFPQSRFFWGALTDLERGEIPALPLAGTALINATPVGMGDIPDMPLSPAALERLPRSALVVDLITRATPLLMAAQARGMPALNGLPMLLHQGAQAFTLWTGQEAPIAAMRAGLGLHGGDDREAGRA